MRRRICLAVGLAALTVPASGWAQSSSQAQYQGVAPETQLPVSGGGSAGGGGVVTSGGSQSGSGGAAATSGGGSGSQATGGGRPASGATGAGSASAPAKISLPAASTSTSPFSGGDIVWIVIAAAGLAGLGLLLRRTTRRSPAV